MRSSRLLLSACGITASLAFSFKATPYGSVNLSSSVDRDVYTMADWASAYGVQQAEGLQLTSYDGKDYFPMTQSGEVDILLIRMTLRLILTRVLCRHKIYHREVLLCSYRVIWSSLRPKPSKNSVSQAQLSSVSIVYDSSRARQEQRNADDR